MTRVRELVRRVSACDHAGEWEQAKPMLMELLRIDPEHRAEVCRALGVMSQKLTRAEEALTWYRQALIADPSDAVVHGLLITLLDISPEETHASLQAERCRWWEQHGVSLYASRIEHMNDRTIDRPLRVGYVSGDFRLHSVMLTVHGLMMTHTPAVVPFFYSSTPPRLYDEVTAVTQRHDGWRDVHDLSDEALADRIRQDGIDILVDLSGYTPFNRLLTFCRKPAPIQVTAWGYATGVGWPAMDVLFSDATVIPLQQRAQYVERIVDLPSVLPYDGMAHPAATTLPCQTRSPTFGVFQRSAKLNDAVLRVWAELLQRLPTSRLVFKSPFYSSATREWIQRKMDVSDRIEFWEGTSYRRHMAAHLDIDVMLDPFPACGGVTSCETLWMGVPPMTLIGDRLVQRVTSSLLTTLGLTDFIATTTDDYIEQAIAWVTVRREELSRIRLTLRDRMAASPLCTGYRETVEGLYRQLWQEWCQS